MMPKDQLKSAETTVLIDCLVAAVAIIAFFALAWCFR